MFVNVAYERFVCGKKSKKCEEKRNGNAEHGLKAENRVN
jgi:hypothetical protein